MVVHKWDDCRLNIFGCHANMIRSLSTVCSNIIAFQYLNLAARPLAKQKQRISRALHKSDMVFNCMLNTVTQALLITARRSEVCHGCSVSSIVMSNSLALQNIVDILCQHNTTGCPSSSSGASSRLKGVDVTSDTYFLDLSFKEQHDLVQSLGRGFTFSRTPR